MSKTLHEVREAARVEADRLHAAFHPEPFAPVWHDWLLAKNCEEHATERGAGA